LSIQRLVYLDIILELFWTGKVRRSIFKIGFDEIIITEDTIDTTEMFLHLTSCQ
jgi:hypothetical protein